MLTDILAELVRIKWIYQVSLHFVSPLGSISVFTWFLSGYCCILYVYIHHRNELGTFQEPRKIIPNGGGQQASIAAGSLSGSTLIQRKEIIFTRRLRKHSYASHFTLALFWMWLSTKPICFAGKQFWQVVLLNLSLWSGQM